jgi:hypothetical protein
MREKVAVELPLKFHKPKKLLQELLKQENL